MTDGAGPTSPGDDCLPPVVALWVRQLCDPSVLGVLEAAGDQNVDVKLSAARGKARRPIIVIGAGPNGH